MSAMLTRQFIRRKSGRFHHSFLNSRHLMVYLTPSGLCLKSVFVIPESSPINIPKNGYMYKNFMDNFQKSNYCQQRLGKVRKSVGSLSQLSKSFWAWAICDRREWIACLHQTGLNVRMPFISNTAVVTQFAKGLAHWPRKTPCRLLHDWFSTRNKSVSCFFFWTKQESMILLWVAFLQHLAIGTTKSRPDTRIRRDGGFCANKLIVDEHHSRNSPDPNICGSIFGNFMTWDWIT